MRTLLLIQCLVEQATALAIQMKGTGFTCSLYNKSLDILRARAHMVKKSLLCMTDHSFAFTSQGLNNL